MEQMLADAAERIFRDQCAKEILDAAEEGQFPARLWHLLCENGFQLMAMPDSGAELADLFAVLRVAGRHAAPLPLAEALLANRWLSEEDGDGPTGALNTVGWVAEDGNPHWRDVPWGRAARRIVGVADDGGVFVGAPVAVTQAVNLAGEPRDQVEVQDVRPLPCAEPAPALLALARAAQSAGALERVLELGIGYAQEREQFGRPIARFQAIQHMLAMVAAEVAAAGRASDAAVAAIGSERFAFEVAAAKSRVGEAVGLVAEAVHQVHGAMGFTYEHQLHHFTRRLWAWRDECGSEAHWQALLGQRLCALGADQVWDFLATSS
ncbi:MAG: acyl-CoA dehydrogenase family protein [Gammaproteobacteria bacterium]|nr:acyl-CoA dehydrogenase family protein [Gammaproteobacteria bacterium]